MVARLLTIGIVINGSKQTPLVFHNIKVILAAVSTILQAIYGIE